MVFKERVGSVLILSLTLKVSDQVLLGPPLPDYLSGLLPSFTAFLMLKTVQMDTPVFFTIFSGGTSEGRRWHTSGLLFCCSDIDGEVKKRFLAKYVCFDLLQLVA